MSTDEAKMSYRERVAARDAYERSGEGQWGMHYMPDARPSPVTLAQEARHRGDQFFQVDLPISWTQGAAAMGGAATRVERADWSADFLGKIEAEGWALLSMCTAFVQTGSSASKRILANVGSTEVATHGYLVGVYLFRAAPTRKSSDENHQAP